ncbi:pimeloyl-[acyl-carrier protein] methyl ester esterase [Ferrigenium kumadai]|uniref:Pimeloyl-[acyl-carrier protein] methyl ester esterase n=1 Tax=Ferrigenium kumadai TaxID=1682490 RepID=A0AAN1SXV7_9PROT|nr:pimeloyl-ACP methyl ester esterase BioH [Ferrigenium kumadai]BBI98662.1 pimeloyl-[acyl-carrier protein] methyl ester esterase [Ferrigenium kumadai]
MSLHVEESGSGEPLLLIHGWGMHGGMWGDVASRLAQDFRVLVVDLPGHGRSPGIEVLGSSSALDAIVDELAERFDESLTVCGWSLGGQIALRWAASHPRQVSRLVMVASTPCFVRQPGWDCAMAPDTLAQFAAALQRDHAATLRRFLALQVRGSEGERELLARLRAALFSRGEPDMAALQSGLEILRDSDQRAALPEIELPVLVIAGERDTLTPPQASRYSAERLPDARLEIIGGAAHAPFLSHPEKFMGSLKSFLHE